MSLLSSGVDRSPLSSVVGYLERAAGRRTDPAQRHAVEAATGAQVHIYPLLARARALPRAREVERPGQVHQLLPVEEPHLRDPPCQRPSVIELQPVESVPRYGRECDCGMQFARGMRHAAGLAQLLPRLPVVRAQHRARPFLVIGALRQHVAVQLQPVHCGHARAAVDFDLQPRARPAQVHRRRPVTVQGQFARGSRQDPLRAGRNRQPARQARFFDSVRDQLRGQVVIVAARLVCRTPQREIAVLLRPRLHRGRPVFFRGSRVHSDAACVFLGFEAGKRKQCGKQ